jgi:pyruvate dehydrogenase E2 component (dihydrolipoamide acetyltransferase)
MNKEIQLPFLAEGIEGGDVVSVLVKTGDEITEGQSVLELETDKATVPVPAPFGGKIAKMLIRQGDHVKVGQTLMEMAAGPGEPAPSRDAKAAETVTAQTATVEAEPAPQPAPKAEPKSAPVYEAQHEGETRKRPRQISATPQPAAPAVKTPETAVPVEPAEATPEAASPATEGPPVPAAPSVRRLARELGVDLRQVKGTEEGGRISQEDVKAYVKDHAGRPGPVAPGKQAPTGTTGETFTTLYGTEHREALPSIRRKIAANMANAWSTIPHVHQFHEADITELIDLQKRYAPKFKEKGATLTLTSLILKAVTHALKAYPHFNSSLDLTNGEIIVKDYYNIGVAVDTPQGLTVPVIHNVDKKPLLEIALELADVAQRTRDKQVKLEELRGATFTVSNLGGMGGGAFTPIINPPEVAILGVGRGKLTPVYRDGKLQPRMLLPLCVAYDHRLIDGADGARFAAEVGKILEDYEAMFLGL